MDIFSYKVISLGAIFLSSNYYIYKKFFNPKISKNILTVKKKANIKIK